MYYRGEFCYFNNSKYNSPNYISNFRHNLPCFLIKYAGGPVGIGEEEIKDRIISLYPNPTKDYITLSVINYNTDTYQFEIFDTYGRLIHTYTNNIGVGMNDVRFNTSTFATGNYILRITTNENTYNQRFTVTR